MTVRFRHVWETLRSSYWFVPTVMTVVAGVLAIVTITLDRRIDKEVAEEIPWVFSGGPEGARAVLEVVAGSVMTTAGIVFSVTIAALSLAASQLGPRLLQNFMRDTGNQVVLGTFIGTFVFCLLVLRTIRGEDAGDFSPPISVTVGVALALASLGVLIFFIHHVSISIQAPHVVAEVGGELGRLVDRVFPEDEALEPPPAARPLPEGFEVRAAPVASRRTGYVQALDEEGLVELASEGGLLIVVERRPGHFTGTGAILAYVWPPEALDERAEKRIRDRFVVGPKRTSEQDVEFAAEQLVEVAVRALSPSLNDPFTAMACLDWLGAGLCRAARGRPSGPERTDDEGHARLVYRSPITFAGLVDRSFDQIRQYGGGTTAVALRMLETIEEVIRCTGGRRDDVLVLLEHAEKLHRAAVEGIRDPRDLHALEARYRRVTDAGGGSEPAPTG